ETMATILQPGVPVEVQFGRRNLLGYVISPAKAEADFEGELKPITALLDDEPVLNVEMLQVGKDMAKQNFCFLVEAYHTMLPNLLKVNYEKFFLPTPEISYLDHQQYFYDLSEIAWSEAEERGILPEVRGLKNKGHRSITEQGK